MALSDATIHVVQSCRRYAALLVGSATLADDALRASLYELLNCSTTSTGEPDLFLYRAITHTATTIPRADVCAASTGDGLDEARTILARMPVLERAAFLLTTSEELDCSRAARVLNIGVDGLFQYLSAAYRSIGRSLCAKTLIIEDEPTIALHLEHVLAELGHDVVGVASNAKSARKIAGAHEPELMLCDVQLGGQANGIEIANEILAERECAVGFITGYPQFFMAYARPEPSFVVGKPIRVAEIESLISQALVFGVTAKSSASPEYTTAALSARDIGALARTLQSL